jgi:UDP-glucose 4-epimerase
MINQTHTLSQMRCVILGAGGFIGTNLCNALVGRVEHLRAFGRRHSFPEAMSGFDWIQGDFADTACLATAVAGCDVVFHLVNAHTPASSNMNKIDDINSNVVSTLKLLDACRETSVRRVVFVSSGGTIYGIPKHVPIPETAPTNPITAYGISKLAIEKYLALYEYLYGLEYRILRVSNPFGPYQTGLKNQGVIPAFIRRALTNQTIEIWGDGSIIRDYLYVDDVINALKDAAIHEGPGRIFNIGSGKGLSLNTIVDSIADHLGTEIKIDYHPGRNMDVPTNILDTKFSKAELKWSANTSFSDGLSKTIEWLKATNNN